MYAIVHSLVLLRDTHNVLFFLSLSFIPLSLIYAGLGFYAVSIIIFYVLHKNILFKSGFYFQPRMNVLNFSLISPRG